DIEPHLAHIGGAGGAHAVADHFRFFHDLLDRELADDAAQMAFHHQPDQTFALFRPLGKELLGGGSNGHGVRFHFQLSDRFDGDGDALVGVEALLRSHVKRHQLERELAALFKHWQDNRAAIRYRSRSSNAVNHQRFVRSYLPQHPCERHKNYYDHQHQQPGDDPYTRKIQHSGPPFSSDRTVCIVRQSEKLFRAVLAPTS